MFVLSGIQFNLRQQGMNILEFLGKMSSIKCEFNSLLPVDKIVTEDLAQWDKFFMVCIIATTGLDLAFVCDQILSSPSIPTLDEVFILIYSVFHLFLEWWNLH